MKEQSIDEAMEEFENLKLLVANFRSILPNLTEGQSQLVGLYMLQALRLGKGTAVDYFPVLDKPKPSHLKVIK